MPVYPLRREKGQKSPVTPIERLIVDPIAPMAFAPLTPMPPAPDVFFAPALAGVARARAAIEDVQGQSPFERQFGGIASSPPESWSQSDPADSLYRLAREALNRGEYRRSAELFGDITQRFPNSVYASDARYWKAFALYRIGSNSDLRAALVSLQDSGRSFRSASLSNDAPVLATRIRAALAAQGDTNAPRQVSQPAVQPGSPRDREDIAVRVESLSSLGRTDH